MQEISKEYYIENLNIMKDTANCSKFNLLITDNDKIYLRADIENEENLRVEMMNFEMNNSLNITDSNSYSRNCGKSIYFIEYDSEEESQKNIVKDFMSIQYNNEEIYLICDENELENILKKYPNKTIYIMSTKDFS